MQEIKKLSKKELENISIRDTGYMDKTTSYYAQLRKYKITNVLQLFDEKLMDETFKYCVKSTYDDMKTVISLLKYRYLGIPIFDKKYFDRKIDLNRGIIKNTGLTLETGEVFYIDSIFATLRGKIFLRKGCSLFYEYEKDKYPDGKAPLIDLLKFMSYASISHLRFPDEQAYLVLRTYISDYEGNNLIEDKEDIMDKYEKEITDITRRITVSNFRLESVKDKKFSNIDLLIGYGEHQHEAVKKLLKGNKINKTSADIAKFLEENDIHDIYRIRFVFEELGLTNNKRLFDNTMDKPLAYYGSESILAELNYVKKVLSFKQQGITDQNQIIDFFKSEKEDENYYWKSIDSRRILDEIYDNIVPEKLKRNPKFIIALLDKFPDSMTFLFKYINDDDKLEVLGKHYSAAYEHCRWLLKPKELDFVIDKIKENGGAYLLHDQEKYESREEVLRSFANTDLVKKLREKYGEQYKEYAKKRNIDPNDDALFINNFLNTIMLKFVYVNGYFNKDDISTVNRMINMLEYSGFNCEKIEERIVQYKKEIFDYERGISRYLSINKDNSEKIDELLKELHVNKDNFFKYIKDRKFLDGKLKESSLLILSKHFKTNYISAYDIVDLMQEMNDRKMTLDEILSEKNMNKKFFRKIYDDFKKSDPIMYNLIKGALKNNSLRGFKKSLKLFYLIKNSRITNYNDFVAKFKSTPEEMLAMFNGSPLYGELYSSMSTWYRFKTKEEDEIVKSKTKQLGYIKISILGIMALIVSFAIIVVGVALLK